MSATCSFAPAAGESGKTVETTTAPDGRSSSFSDPRGGR
jgi:hypothetical protein